MSVSRDHDTHRDSLPVVAGEAYGLGGRRLGRGPVTEKRGCAKKKVVTPLLAWHVQDEE